MTGYTVHYSGGGDTGSVNVGPSTTAATITGRMNDGHTYTITVEVKSEHLSRESTASVTLCECHLHLRISLKTRTVLTEITLMDLANCLKKSSIIYFPFSLASFFTSFSISFCISTLFFIYVITFFLQLPHSILQQVLV